MHYMGGKFRQSKAICEVLKPYFDSVEKTVYVEPFMGGCNSAARVAKELKPDVMILGDTIRSLVMFHEKCYIEGTDWIPLDITREQFNYYKSVRPDDPMTAWVGLGCCLLPDWFHSYANYAMEGNRNGQRRCTQWLRECNNVQFVCCSYDELDIPDGSIVYCDPPYANSNAIKYGNTFDHGRFWQWVRKLSKRCVVFVSCFECPEDFETVYEWGDTVTTKYKKDGSVKKRRVENEKLVRYKEEEMNEQKWWIFTFGYGQEYEGNYVKIYGTYSEAREKMINKYGLKWAFQYSEEEWIEWEKRRSIFLPVETLLEVIE